MTQTQSQTPMITEPKPGAGRPSASAEHLFLTPRVLDGNAYDELSKELASVIGDAKAQCARLDQEIGSIAAAATRLRGVGKQAEAKIRLGTRLAAVLDERLQSASELSAELRSAHGAIERLKKISDELQSHYDELERSHDQRLIEQRLRYEQAMEQLKADHEASMAAFEASYQKQLTACVEEAQAMQRDHAVQMEAATKSLEQTKSEFTAALAAARRDLAAQCDQFTSKQQKFRLRVAAELETARKAALMVRDDLESRVERVASRAVDQAVERVAELEERISAIRLASDAIRRSLTVAKSESEVAVSANADAA
jgi:hypothetical protein